MRTNSRYGKQDPQTDQPNQYPQQLDFNEGRPISEAEAMKGKNAEVSRQSARQADDGDDDSLYEDENDQNSKSRRQRAAAGSKRKKEQPSREPLRRSATKRTKRSDQDEPPSTDQKEASEPPPGDSGSQEKRSGDQYLQEVRVQILRSCDFLQSNLQPMLAQTNYNMSKISSDIAHVAYPYKTIDQLGKLDLNKLRETIGFLKNLKEWILENVKDSVGEIKG